MKPQFWRKVALLALPIAMQIFLQAMLGMADVAMVSGLGAEAVAAVGLAAKLHFLVLVFMIGVASAGSILCSQYIGAKDSHNCQKTLAMTLISGAILALPFVVAFAASGHWLALVNPDTNVVGLAAKYLLITCSTVWVVQVLLAYEACLRSLGVTIPPLVFGAITTFLNVFLNYLFIFGHWGFPAMGVEGAAWGTLLARCAQLLLVLIWLYATKHLFALRFSVFLESLNRHSLLPFVVFAAPIVINHAIWGLGNTVYHVATGFAGTEALAVMGAMAPVESAFFALFIGLANACAVLVGQALGANKNEHAWQLYRLFDRLSLILVSIFGLFLWWAKEGLVNLFSSLDASTASLLTDTLVIFCFVAVVKIMNMIRILGVLRAGGDTHYCLQVDIVVMWVFGLPVFVYAVYAQWPFLILFALMALEDVLKFLPILLRVKQKRWMQNLTHGHS